MTSVNIEKIAEILRDAAKCEIMPRFRRLDDDMIREKTSATDLVTEADEAAERAIMEQVKLCYPKALFVGEESVAADPALLVTLRDANMAIIVDPIDGTANYAAGTPLFGVMASVVIEGEVVAGIIYDPLGDDWVMAEKGAGAWQIRPDGTRWALKAADPAPLDAMVGAASFNRLPRPVRAEILANLAKVAVSSSYRCAAHEYRMAAAGHIHFLMHSKLMPWDHLAGALVMQEAGGHAARLDGSAYLPSHTDGGLLIAPDRESWDLLRREVFTV